MNTDQLRYFMAIAHHRNFTEAAKEFYITQPAITQPAITHQIAALEKELGTPLFKRTTRSVTLTEAGKLFAEHAKHILDQEENALRNLQMLRESGTSKLRIGYLNAPCQHFLPQILADFTNQYPQIMDVLFAVECKLGITILPRHVQAYIGDNLVFVPIPRSNLSIECGVAWQEHYENPSVKWLLDLLNYYLVEQPEVF